MLQQNTIIVSKYSRIQYPTTPFLSQSAIIAGEGRTTPHIIKMLNTVGSKDR